MNIDDLIKNLEHDKTVIYDLLDGVEDEQMRWKPAEDRWSLLEVLNHLADEERQDFKTCLRNIIEDPGIDWPDISPMAWVTERSYNTKSVLESVNDFIKERDASIAWLLEQNMQNLDTVHQGKHPFRQPMKTGDIIISWIAHDYFHLRQITNLKWEYLIDSSRPYSCGYAGEF